MSLIILLNHGYHIKAINSFLETYDVDTNMIEIHPDEGSEKSYIRVCSTNTKTKEEVSNVLKGFGFFIADEKVITLLCCGYLFDDRADIVSQIETTLGIYGIGIETGETKDNNVLTEMIIELEKSLIKILFSEKPIGGDEAPHIKVVCDSEKITKHLLVVLNEFNATTAD